MRIATRTLVCCGLVAGAFLLAARAARAGGDWNDQGVKWVPYADGLATAKKEKKPVCLVFYTEWCPHCQNYSGRRASSPSWPWPVRPCTPPI